MYHGKEESLQIKVGLKIKALRKEKGWTLEELANRLNSSKQAISNIEQGRNNISLSTLERYAKAFGIDPRDLL